MEIKEIIKSYKDEMIMNLTKLISYRSVLGEESKNAPFGIECAKCLQEALNIADKYGFKTKNLDNYCGYAEIGEGEEIVGIVAHLDVVPEGNGWNTNPYEATMKENKIYGRGTSDDKGAVIASMTALKIIKDMNIPINKKVRLIMGCNEETGSKCMKHYIEKEGDIDIGFTPDGDFPVVNGEKGQIKLKFKCNNKNNIFINGGVVSNAVSDNCSLKLSNELYNKESFEKYLKQNNIEYSIIENGGIDEIKVKGKSAHASNPSLGINAISYTIMALKEAGYEDDLVKFYSKFINIETNGESFGIKLSDKYGELTFVNGMIFVENDLIVGTIDIRVPILIDSKELADKILLKEYGETILEVESITKSLYYPEDSKLVTALMKAYRDVTGDENAKPFTIGGGTYAKSMNNCVAFGCEFPNTDNRIHNANEFVDIDELLLQVELYVYAILELIK